MTPGGVKVAMIQTGPNSSKTMSAYSRVDQNQASFHSSSVTLMGSAMTRWFYKHLPQPTHPPSPPHYHSLFLPIGNSVIYLLSHRLWTVGKLGENNCHELAATVNTATAFLHWLRSPVPVTILTALKRVQEFRSEDPAAPAEPTLEDLGPLPGLGLDLCEPPLEVSRLKHVHGQGGDVFQHHAVMTEAAPALALRVLVWIRPVVGMLVGGATVGAPHILLGHDGPGGGVEGERTEEEVNSLLPIRF